MSQHEPDSFELPDELADMGRRYAYGKATLVTVNGDLFEILCRLDTSMVPHRNLEADRQWIVDGEMWELAPPLSRLVNDPYTHLNVQRVPRED